jgi:hypothetical protein
VLHGRLLISTKATPRGGARRTIPQNHKHTRVLHGQNAGVGLLAFAIERNSNTALAVFYAVNVKTGARLNVHQPVPSTCLLSGYRGLIRVMWRASFVELGGVGVACVRVVWQKRHSN